MQLVFKKPLGDNQFSRRIFILTGFSLLDSILNFKKIANAQETTFYNHTILSDEEGNLYSKQFYTEFKRILKGAHPLTDSTFRLELPEYAENGSIVPFKISVDSPMTPSDYVQSLHLFSSFNPNPWVANFHLSPHCGKAQVSGRMRLSKTQNVYALAQLNNGRFLIAKQHVEVLIGGCGMD